MGVLYHLKDLSGKIASEMTYNVSSGMLNPRVLNSDPLNSSKSVVKRIRVGS